MFEQDDKLGQKAIDILRELFKLGRAYGITVLWASQNIHVRCPCCKTGRICDKPSGTRIKDVPQRDTPINGNEPTVILKCPKCGKKFSIQLNNTK